jgi:hypothetical protein
MVSESHASQSDKIEQRALERELVAQLSPDKATQSKAKAKAERLRQLLERVKARDNKEQD